MDSLIVIRGRFHNLEECKFLQVLCGCWNTIDGFTLQRTKPSIPYYLYNVLESTLSVTAQFPRLFLLVPSDCCCWVGGCLGTSVPSRVNRFCALPLLNQRVFMSESISWKLLDQLESECLIVDWIALCFFFMLLSVFATRPYTHCFDTLEQSHHPTSSPTLMPQDRHTFRIYTTSYRSPYGILALGYYSIGSL